MKKFTYCLLPVFILSAPVLAQTNPSSQIYSTYHAAKNLLDEGKYVAAAQQYRLFQNLALKTSNQSKFESELTLLEEDSQYYLALCALE